VNCRAYAPAVYSRKVVTAQCKLHREARGKAFYGMLSTLLEPVHSRSSHDSCLFSDLRARHSGASATTSAA